MRKNIRLIIYLTLAVLLTQTITAQPVVPGFGGKHFFVEGNFAFVPSLVGVNKYNEKVFIDRKYKYGFPISWRGGIGLHYINGRRENLFLCYDLLQTGLTATLKTPVLVSNSSNNKTEDTHHLFSQLDVHIVSFGRETTPSGRLAPLGPYSRISIQGLFISSTILDKQTNLATTDLPRITGDHLALGIDNFKTWEIGFGYELGYRYIIAKKIFLNTAICTNINFRGLGKILSQPVGTDYLEYNNDHYEKDVLIRLGFHSLLLFKVGLAYPF